MKLEAFSETNSKKKFIVIFTIICIALVVGVFLYHSYAWFTDENTFNSFSGNVTPVGDVYFAVYVDSIASDNVPAKGAGYTFDHADCTNNATLTWDNTTWNAKINNLTSTRTKCTLYFAEDRSATSVIARLAGNADPTSTEVIDNGSDASGCTNTLAYDDYGNLRFVGANPCNYVTFNGETAGWRIIGVIDGKVKLIRNESIGSYSWDTSASSVNKGLGINQWGESGTYKGADLMKLLNPGFDTNLAEDSSGNAITGTYANNSLYWNKQSGNCYNSSKNVYTTCDFSTTGLNESAKSMIDKHTWNLGSQGENDAFTSGNGLGLASKFYEYERSNSNGKICTSGSECNDNVSRTTTWEGYVGIMSPSDYGYAVGGEVRESCLANTNLFNYNTNNCYSNDWLYKNSTYQWTMSPNANSSYARNVFGVLSDGYVFAGNANGVCVVRPALFLISGVKINGDGTPNAPFTLSLN